MVSWFPCVIVNCLKLGIVGEFQSDLRTWLAESICLRKSGFAKVWPILVDILDLKYVLLLARKTENFVQRYFNLVVIRSGVYDR
jgi:hypothetical protein